MVQMIIITYIIMQCLVITNRVELTFLRRKALPLALIHMTHDIEMQSLYCSCPHKISTVYVNNQLYVRRHMHYTLFDKAQAMNFSIQVFQAKLTLAGNVIPFP